MRILDYIFLFSHFLIFVFLNILSVINIKYKILKKGSEKGREGPDLIRTRLEGSAF
jgi:hypothetical protein